MHLRFLPLQEVFLIWGWGASVDLIGPTLPRAAPAVTPGINQGQPEADPALPPNRIRRRPGGGTAFLGHGPGVTSGLRD